mgnify:CR=1 FL=1
MEEKSKQIWFRFNNDQKQLKVDCVDLLTKCYMMLGQKPEAQQIVIMAQFLYEDLINNYSRMTLEEVYFALEKGIRQGEEASCFINVRSWNLWLKEHKKSEALKRQQRLITDYQKHEQSQKAIGNTINKAKQLK